MSQYARPNSDITYSGWATSSGGVPGIGGVTGYSFIDEVVPDDADYIFSSENPDGSQPYECGMSAVIDPQSDIMERYYRASKSGGKSASLDVDIWFGGSRRTLHAATALSDTWATVAGPSQTISGFSGSGFSLLFVPVVSGGGSPTSARVSWAQIVTSDTTPATTDSFTQSSFRFRNDDGDEDSATWKAALNSNINL